MDPAAARYAIEVNGHLGATILSALPAMASESRGRYIVLIGILDRSALYGVLGEIDGSASNWSRSASSRDHAPKVEGCGPATRHRPPLVGLPSGPGHRRLRPGAGTRAGPDPASSR